MTNDERSPNDQMTKHGAESAHRRSDFVTPSGVGIRHSSLSSGLIATSAQLTELLEKIEPVDRVAIDTEADSLHCYREKLCLLQISVPAEGSHRGYHNAAREYTVDPLAEPPLPPLWAVLR